MNCVQLSGNICKDLKLSKTDNGKIFLRNTIGVSRDRLNASGIKETDFIDFILFENKAEYLSKYGQKGDKIELSGSLRKDTYKDKEGNYKENNYVVVDTIKILTARPKNQEKPF